MAKTPLKRRRAASPPPRKKVRAPRPTRKGTSPYHSDKNFAVRTGRMSLLFYPLTPEQEEDIRTSFGMQRQRDAKQLLRDWTHISYQAYGRTLAAYSQTEIERVLFTGRAGQQRDTRLTKATAAATEAIKAVKEMVVKWRSDTDSVALALRTNPVIATLTNEREAIEQYRTRAGQWPKYSVKRGQPEQPATYRLKVLAAYFRHHGWRVSSREHSLFAKLAVTVTTGNPVNHTLLKAVVASRDSYTPPTT